MGDERSYNHKDIQRYLQHQMSVEEMHAFEKAMMDDPFLADALEGYTNADKGLSTQHLTEINKAISGEKVEKKVVPLVGRKNNFLRIAALFILIAGAGIIAYKSLNNTPKEKAIAAAVPVPETVTHHETIKALEPPPPPTRAETSADKNAPIFKKGSRQITTPQPAQTGEAKPLENNNEGALIAMQQDKVKDEASRKSISSDSTPMFLQRSVATRQMTMKQPAPQQEIKGQVVDDKGAPVPGATVSTYYKNNAIADRDGNFTIKAPDSIVDVNVDAVGYTPATAKIKTGQTNNKIVLSENNMNLSEVVVTRIGLGKKANVKDKATSTAEPEGGWENFNRYIDSSLNKAKTSNEVANSGDVELEFLVDPTGKPFDIKTTNSSDKVLEDKAIQLIQKGPKWKTRHKKAKAKVTITF